MNTRTRPTSTLSAIFATLIAALSMSYAANAQDLVISGVIDGPLSGGTPKAVEFYVINDIADLSEYGASSANNGNGPTGAPEFTFPAIGVTAGSYLYVASESANFTAFFGFAPDFTDGQAPSINGDDAIELFQNGVVVDVFGDVNTDGTGQPWDHVDGWAYRVDETGPDGAIFSLSSWTFSSPNALDRETTNATAVTPFPIGTYIKTAGDAAPRVIATTPAEGDSGVAVDANIELVFSEPVMVMGGWFDLTCAVSGTLTATDSSPNSTTFTLDPAAEFVAGESCSVTVFASLVSDIDAEDPPDNMAADFTLTFTTATAMANAIVINEFLADPPSGISGDANGDGTRNGSQDEFVEVVNASGAPLDISGWTVADSVGTRHTFPNGTVLAPDCGAVVFGGGSPVGVFGNMIVQTATGGFLGFNNSGDSVIVRDVSGAEVASTSYSSTEGNDQSLTRNPDLTGAFVDHLSVNGAPFSPGTKVDDSAFSGCPVFVQLAIHEVQGAGNATPFDGQSVAVEGIVTGDLQNNDADSQNSIRGFYVQDAPADADADPATSDGIFVFDGSSPSTDVAVGDRIRVEGTAVEFFGETQINAGSVTVLSSGNSVAPTPVTLPAADALFVSGQYIPDLERYEGMLVTFPGTLYATDLFNLDRFGVIQLIDGGVPFGFTNFAEPDAVALDAYLRDIGTRTIMLDDGLTVQNPDPIRYPAPGLPNSVGAIVRTGDTVTGLTGNIRYSRGSGGSGEDFYRLMPTAEPQFVAENPRPASPPDVGGSLKVASFNVLNFFTTIDLRGNTCGPLGDRCRGADSELEFDRQLAKIVAAITELDADVVGLVELENSDGDTLPVLVDALNAAPGAAVYDFIDTGFIGFDAIKVGLIYQPAAVTPEGPFAVLDSDIDPAFLDTKNRPVLAQTFREAATGGVITLAVNHLKSKGSPCDDVGDPNTGDGQGNCNLTRTTAAQATVEWLATDPTGSADDDFLVIGDLNAYLQEDPIDAYRDGGYSSLLETFVGSNAYTFSFSQQRGVLDYALSSESLLSQVTGAGAWHINTDEADALDYNLDFGRNPAIFAPDAFRSSDHDAVVVGLALIGDRDRDGVLNADDVCPATMIPEAVPTRELKPNRFALADEDLVFDTGKAKSKFLYTTIDTAGCSCEQIIEETGAGNGHTKFGCSNGLMKDWVELVGQ